jgi:PAS domain S-box-containing protein
VHPEDVDLWRENVRACIEEGKEHRIDFRIVRPDGMIRWVGAYGNTVRDDNGKPVQMLGVVIDITDRKTMENELRESEELYRRFFDSSPYALFIGGPFILNKPNPSAVRMFGASSEEMRLSRPEDFSPQFQPDGMLSSEKAAFYIEEALDGRPQFFEWRSRRKDGTEFDSEVSLIRVDRHGEPQLMTTIKDITERKKAEESLIASLHEKETLLQEIYHRTKNNMQVIASLLNLQASSSDSPEVVGIIEDSTNRIRTMALAHEKLYRGGNLSRINMKEYITELARLMLSGSESVSDRVNLRFDLQEIEMLIDLAVPCGLIINELLTNSLKHAFPQGRKGWIRLGLKSIGKNALELEVQDNGIGLPADFDVSDAPTLGIQLVRRIALHQLHGDISARVDNGLCWCIRFRNDLYTERVKE